MKRILIFLICLSVVVLPCFATDDTLVITEAVTQSTVTVPTENLSEPTTEKATEPTTKAQPTTEKTAPIVEKEEVEEIPEDNSQPRLMVVSYEIEDGFISPEETKILTITLKNMHCVLSKMHVCWQKRSKKGVLIWYPAERILI